MYAKLAVDALALTQLRLGRLIQTPTPKFKGHTAPKAPGKRRPNRATAPRPQASHRSQSAIGEQHKRMPVGHHAPTHQPYQSLASRLLGAKITAAPMVLAMSGPGVGVKRKLPTTTTTSKKKPGRCNDRPQVPVSPPGSLRAKTCPAIGDTKRSTPMFSRPGKETRPAIGDDKRSTNQFLEDLRQEKLQGATWKKGQLFVDLFSGKRSPVGRQIGKRGGAVISFDILIDGRFDLRNPQTEHTLMVWIQQGWVWGVWLGTECKTWSLASYSKGPGWFNSYRSKQNLWGEMSSLSLKAQEKVRQGNADAEFTIRVLRKITNQPLAVAGLENPAGSVIWKLPELMALELSSRAHQSTCHYCSYGARWKKPTKLLFIGGAKAQAPRKLCACSPAKLPHLKLGGGRRHPVSGKLLTKLATEYPTRLAAQLANCLAGDSGPA